MNNNLDTNINPNVLEVIDKLVSINAIAVLKDFEIENSSSELCLHYDEKKEKLIKTHIKGN